LKFRKFTNKNIILKNKKFLLINVKELICNIVSNDNETKIMGSLSEKVFMFYLAELFQIKESVGLTHGHAHIVGIVGKKHGFSR
jgi:hypothetical protein